MTRLAMLFPGQGSQYPQMSRDLLRCPAGLSLLAEAEAVSGLALRQLMTTADAAALAESEVAQVSVLTHSLALLDQLSTDGVEPQVVAGHSMGEYTAMVAAGMLERTTAMALVAQRGRAMSAACRTRPGAMGAVVGLSLEQVQQLCHAVESPVVIANINSPRQHVVSGEPTGVDAVLTAAKAAGALRARMLPVGGAFHSPLMDTATEAMAEIWAGVRLASPRCTFVSSVSGAVVTDPGAHHVQMYRQITSVVRWSRAMTAVTDLGVRAVVEVGPGRVLAGLAREQAPHLPQWALRPGVSMTGSRLAS